MSTLAFSSEIAMGRRPILWTALTFLWTHQEGRNLILALFTERGAPHLRARCARCDHTFDGELQPATPPSIHCSTITHQLTWCQFRLFAAALGELGPRLEIAILEYAILQHSLFRRAKFSACGGRAENSSRCQHAARISVVRGSTRRSFALLEGSLLQGALCSLV